jgi:EmrB/QacA subfamily drug resistance transporter
MRAVAHLFDQVEYRYLVAAAFVFGLFMDILDTTIVNVALPRLAEEFHADTATLEWVVTGYVLSLAVWVPASGWIGDRFGTKKTFLFATAMFIIGSALCGRAWSIESLVLFRIVQGIGGGMLTPVGTAMLYRAFTPAERARASAILSIPTMFAPMLGPLFGGFLVDAVSWRWIFYVNVPVGVLSFAFSWLVLKEHREPAAGKFDPAGFVFSGFGMAGVLFALSRGPDDGWASPLVLLTGLGGLACFALLVLFETRNRAPMLDLTLYCSKLFRTANLTGFMFMCTQFGMLFVLPLFLQQLRGLSAFESGLTTFPQPVGQIIMVQFTSRMYHRLGARLNLLIGTGGIMLTTGLFLLVNLDTGLWWIRGLVFLRGCFIAFNMVSMQTALFSAVPREKTGRASSLWNTTRQLAVAMGVAVAASVLIASLPGSAGGAGGLAGVPADFGLRAFHTTIAVLAVLGGLAVYFASQVRDPRPLAEPAKTRLVPVGEGHGAAGARATAVARDVVDQRHR